MPVHCEIHVRGILDAHWSSWFEGLDITPRDADDVTVISGPLADQAALHGVLTKIRDLGLVLLEVLVVDPHLDDETDHG